MPQNRNQPRAVVQAEYRLLNLPQYAGQDELIAARLTELAKEGWRVHTYDFNSRRALLERTAP